MKIQPEAINAVVIILEDGSEIKTHNTVHGDADYLFLNNRGGLRVETTADRMNWKTIATDTMIRISVVKEVKK